MIIGSAAEGPFQKNGYVLGCERTKEAVYIDPGDEVLQLLDFITEQGLKVSHILLTHAHVDHVMALPDLLKGTRAKAWINARDEGEEDFPKNAQTFATGQSFVLGSLRIESRLTSGHSAGQTTYVVKGLEHRLAVVGDSLFAGSMGGGMVSYRDQHRNDVEQILTLPDDTILACGHGPLTTLKQEKQHNPFFTR